MKTAIGPTKFALKATTLGARPTKRQMSHGEELDEASEQSRQSLSKTLFALSRCRITEGDDFRDMLS
jgi:hypothetical protein